MKGQRMQICVDERSIHRLIETPPETQSQEELIQLELAFLSVTVVKIRKLRGITKKQKQNNKKGIFIPLI
jgi:hypothetical protein